MANGIIIIDKPAGWTSMDVCGKLRGILKTKKVGHAGTLDPMATGVLPVFVGSATRAVSYAEAGDKEYIAGLRLGLVTNTQDTSGEVLEQHPAEGITRGQLEAVLARFTGEIQQVPPMYSAIKIGGQKLYELARKGQEIERPARTVTIHGLELLEPGLCRVTVREGKFHQVKRMLASRDLPVLALERRAMGYLELDEGLAPGQLRPLTEAELQALREG